LGGAAGVLGASSRGPLRAITTAARITLPILSLAAGGSTQSSTASAPATQAGSQEDSPRSNDTSPSGSPGVTATGKGPLSFGVVSQGSTSGRP
jgi:hypothetical protein